MKKKELHGLRKDNSLLQTQAAYPVLCSVVNICLSCVSSVVNSSQHVTRVPEMTHVYFPEVGGLACPQPPKLLFKFPRERAKYKIFYWWYAKLVQNFNIIEF